MHQGLVVISVIVVCVLASVSGYTDDWVLENALAYKQDWTAFSDDKVWTSEREKRGQRFCGDNLVAILSVVCDGKYNKRFWQMDAESSQDGGNWGPRTRALEKPSWLAMMSRVRRGIVDECCRNGCTTKQLSAYCSR